MNMRNARSNSLTKKNKKLEDEVEVSTSPKIYSAMSKDKVIDSNARLLKKLKKSAKLLYSKFEKEQNEKTMKAYLEVIDEICAMKYIFQLCANLVEEVEQKNFNDMAINVSKLKRIDIN